MIYEIIAMVLASIGAVLLLSAAAALFLGRSSQFESRCSELAADCDGSVASWRQRREVLQRRLDIDEPRYCTRSRVSCTCWSFCGGAEVNSLPVVRRAGVADCPFRFSTVMRTSIDETDLAGAGNNPVP